MPGQKHLPEPLICAIVLLSIVCFFGTVQATEDTYQGPPRDLVAGNLSQCEQAVEILVKSVRTEKIFGHGNGKGAFGYVQCLVVGVITRSFKGSLSKGREISYHFTCEYDNIPKCPVTKGSSYVIFLKKNPTTNEYWLFAEAAQFQSTPELLEILEQTTISK
ncbi:MAG TPA: hypothetical protein ENG51_19180 [Deltaproteobacteria bacterium]|nr:hypothetical protein [Deltaproteobacteria bacterium]